MAPVSDRRTKKELTEALAEAEAALASRAAGPRKLHPMASALCVMLPAASFGMSWLAGVTLPTVRALGVCAALLVGFILAVSARHVAHAVAHLWGTGARDAWLVAAALEAAIIVLDMAHLMGPASVRGPCLWASAIPVAAVAYLNIHAIKNPE